MRVRITGLVVTTLVGACQGHDLGSACDVLSGEDTTVSGETSVETLEIVGQSAAYPCDELICIATDGIDSYCSRKCRNNSGCPEGFECRVIHTLGKNSGEMYCAWKRCSRRADCGKSEDFCCKTVDNSAPIQELEIKLCTFSNGGKC